MRFPPLMLDRDPAAVDGPLSARRLRDLDDAERLMLWALRHRVAAGAPARARLVDAFDVLGGAAGARARGALERPVEGFETFARRPLAVLDWCNDAVTADEAALLAICAEAQIGRPTPAGLDALVVPEGAVAVREALRALVRQLAAAGAHLPFPVPTTPLGEHDVADHPFAVH